MDLVRVVGVGLMIALYFQMRRDAEPDPVEVDKMRRRMLDATVLAHSIG